VYLFYVSFAVLFLVLL